VNIFVFGSSILSSYWNGAATYYRGIYKELARLGHHITFAEPDAFGRQQHRDPGDYSFVRSIIYTAEEDLSPLTAEASEADLIVKHSGVGVGDEALEALVLDCRRQGNAVVFWDVDAPATLARIAEHPSVPFRKLIPRYDAILTYGGGSPVVEQYESRGARVCLPIYNALDPETHFPVEPVNEWKCDLAFVGNRLPDRERRVDELFLRAAAMAPEMHFLLGGEGWGGKALPENVRWIGHVPTGKHNAVNCSARMVLNINRDSMASVGFSPPTRVFEAAGSGACLLCDAWPGVERFFTPGRELLVVRSADEIVGALRYTSAREAETMGEAFRARALEEHTYAQRAAEFDRFLSAVLLPNGAVRGSASSSMSDARIPAVEARP
jgi:spore maturation protein CgeB